MGLYEIRTGYTGCSYERCYVWTESPERATEMFLCRYPHRPAPVAVELLFSSELRSEFITLLDDEGFVKDLT